MPAAIMAIAQDRATVEIVKRFALARQINEARLAIAARVVAQRVNQLQIALIILRMPRRPFPKNSSKNPNQYRQLRRRR